jgi:hypothetical protein
MWRSKTKHELRKVLLDLCLKIQSKHVWNLKQNFLFVEIITIFATIWMSLSTASPQLAYLRLMCAGRRRLAGPSGWRAVSAARTDEAAAAAAGSTLTFQYAARKAGVSILDGAAALASRARAAVCTSAGTQNVGETEP